jgi:hypothetical protein
MLAVAFGSKDGKASGISNCFDRARLQARIQYEERKAQIRRREHLFDSGSPDGSFERLPAKHRDAAFAAARRVHADMYAASKGAMMHPAALRAEMASLLKPFDEEDED